MRDDVGRLLPLFPYSKARRSGERFRINGAKIISVYNCVGYEMTKSLQVSRMLARTVLWTDSGQIARLKLYFWPSGLLNLLKLWSAARTEWLEMAK